MTKHVEVMDLVARLKAAEETFVLATVVRTVSVTAAKAGAKAIIRPDGTIVAGGVGGGRARRGGVEGARRAPPAGRPRPVPGAPGKPPAAPGVHPRADRRGGRPAPRQWP